MVFVIRRVLTLAPVFDNETFSHYRVFVILILLPGLVADFLKMSVAGF